MKRILIVEDAPEIRRIMEYALQSDDHELMSVDNGIRAFEVVPTFLPDLIILDIMMPGIHGLEVLKKIKADPATRHIGIIICSGKQYKSDIDHAIRLGAADYISKPFDMDSFAAKVDAYFLSQSSPESIIEESSQKIFIPTLNQSQCYIKFWGCRGSVPVAGQKYLRYGGNTPCLELNCGEEIIVIDAGTGIRELGMRLLEQHVQRIHLFIGHTHWDHIQGFPFFAPAYEPEQEMCIYGAAGYGKDLKSTLSGQLASEYFPVQLEDMKAHMTFVELVSNPISICGVNVFWEYVHHPGAALGFKFVLHGKTIVYITDNEFLQGYVSSPHTITEDSPLLGHYRNLLKFIQDADILISEAQYPNEEYVNKIGWGHTSLTNACLMAKFGKVKRWIITHHDPMHDDHVLDQNLLLIKHILHDLHYSIEVSHAYDGMKILI